MDRFALFFKSFVLIAAKRVKSWLKGVEKENGFVGKIIARKTRRHEEIFL